MNDLNEKSVGESSGDHNNNTHTINVDVVLRNRYRVEFDSLSIGEGNGMSVLWCVRLQFVSQSDAAEFVALLV